MTRSRWEDMLEQHLSAAGLPAPTREYRFLPTRRFRMDFAWPDVKVAVEVEGGTFIQGRHSRGVGMAKDMEKANLAALAGWLVLRVNHHHVRDGTALRWVESALEGRLAAHPKDAA